jgi:hypothetical protein
MMSQNERMLTLRNFLVSKFSKGDILNLLFDLGKNSSTINQEAALSALCLDVVQTAGRQGWLTELWNYTAKERPNLGLPLWDGSFPEPEPIIEVEPKTPEQYTKLIEDIRVQLTAGLIRLAELEAILKLILDK